MRDYRLSVRRISPGVFVELLLLADQAVGVSTLNKGPSPINCIDNGIRDY